MGRPILLNQRIPLPASAAPGVLSAEVVSDPSTLAPPEDMQIDYIYFDEETNQVGDVVVRPSLGERSYWPSGPMPVLNYNNIARSVDSCEYGEFWLENPYVLPRKHGISLSMQNRGPNDDVSGRLSFQGIGVQSKRPYDLTIDFDLPAGGVIRQIGGRQMAIQAKEDVEIHALAWKRSPDSEGWNPWLIGLQVEPSYGSYWSARGSTVGAAGIFLPPLTAYSNVRGPRVGAFYRPPRDVVLEQGDAITFEFQNAFQAERTALVTIVGTAMASIKSSG